MFVALAVHRQGAKVVVMLIDGLPNRLPQRRHVPQRAAARSPHGQIPKTSVKSPTEIGRALGRSKGTISRELWRNIRRGRYSALEAHRQADRCRQRALRRKRDDPDAQVCVRRGLAQRWPPEQSAGRMPLETPEPARTARLASDVLSVVRINAPELYRDPEFVAWLNDPDHIQATWHRKGKPPGDYSDIFLTFSALNEDGSDSDMPRHCWEQLCGWLRQAGVRQDCVVWLSNIQDYVTPPRQRTRELRAIELDTGSREGT